jgi:ketosteroid isomerase-like protein
MPRENFELVRRFCEDWNRGDMDAALECAHIEMEFDWSDSRGPLRGTYRGHEGLARFWTELWEAWDDFRLELGDAIECGRERLVTVTTVWARGRGSGIEIEARGAMLWTLREGKILRGKLFQTREEALEAAALPV